jgi:hypothetical protein
MTTEAQNVEVNRLAGPNSPLSDFSREAVEALLVEGAKS